MLLDFAKLESRHAYQWMISTIVPRPIAWVSTMGAEGQVNLAPFSFFNGITSRPPTLMFVPVTKVDGTAKDTLRNIEATGEFVVNLVSENLVAAMNNSAAPLPYGESEFAHFGIEAAASERVKPPRVRAARVAFECTLQQIVKQGDAPGMANVVFGRIHCAHVADEVLDANGRVDPAKLDLIGRMGGDDYCTTRDRFVVERPQ
ncbi:MAG: flavin reductase family protein [Candidatus Synoicihabitans palmerolidicus]|nr:flavin reductase family protein [Candidatus Synoicihabitans palmerolidicus]